MKICKKCHKTMEKARVLQSTLNLATVRDETEEENEKYTCERTFCMTEKHKRYFPRHRVKSEIQYFKCAVLTKWPGKTSEQGIDAWRDNDVHKYLPELKDSHLKIIPGMCPIPGGRNPLRYMMDCTDYSVFDPIYNSDFNRKPSPQWCDDMFQFFLTLTQDDFINILTYGLAGDKIVNQYYQRQSGRVTEYPNSRHSNDVFTVIRDFTPDGTTDNNFIYCLFEPQARKALYMPYESVEELNDKMLSLDDSSWDNILSMYARDMKSLFSHCPALKEPMTVFRGEDIYQNRKDNLSFDVGTVSFESTPSRTITTPKSFTLDPCIACYFSRKNDFFGQRRDQSEAGRIWMTTFDTGSKLLFVPGFNCVDDMSEAECRVEPPCVVKNARDITHSICPTTWGDTTSDKELASLQIVYADATTTMNTNLFHSHISEMGWNVVRAIRSAR